MPLKKTSSKSSNDKQTNFLSISPEDAKKSLHALIKQNSIYNRDSILKSGRISTVSFDLKETMLGAEGSFLSAICLFDLIKSNVKAVGGFIDSTYSLSVAVSMLASISGQELNCFYVRELGDAKVYGKSKIIDGPLKAGSKVCLIQDLVTSGSSLIEMIRTLKEQMGVTVEQVVSLLDRNDGAVRKFDELGIDYSYVFSVKEFVKEEIYSNV